MTKMTYPEVKVTQPTGTAVRSRVEAALTKLDALYTSYRRRGDDISLSFAQELLPVILILRESLE